jgi:signal transduction histidine kinase
MAIDAIRVPMTTLRLRVLIALLLLSTAPLALVAFQGYHCGAEAIVSLAQNQLNAALAAGRLLVAQRMATHETELQLFVSRQDPAFFATLTEDKLRSAMSQLPAASTLSWHDAEGRALSNTARPANTLVPGNPPIARILTELDQWHSDRNVPVVWRAVQTGGRPEVPRGYLVAGYVLADIIPELLVGDSGPANVHFALERNTDPAGTGNSGVDASPSGLLPPRELRWWDHLHLGHEPVIAGEIGLPFSGWRLHGELESQGGVEWLQILVFRSTGTVLVTVLAVFVVAWWLSSQLGRPLKELARVSHKIRGGHMQERIPPMNTQEAEEVRHAFNTMMDSIDRQQETISRNTTLATIGELTSSIVHEMRNPLSTIRMNFQALSQTALQDDVARELASMGVEQSARVETMLNELLQYGRPLDLRPQPVLFSDLVSETLATLPPEVRDKTTIVDNVHQSCLYIDPEHARRALANLLLNAHQASGSNGRIVVSCCRYVAKGDMAEVYVEDNGPGIPPQVQDRLFKPFFSTKDLGTGLGLANVKKVVELHGGEVWATNVSTGGARVCMTLPVAAPVAVPQ